MDFMFDWDGEGDRFSFEDSDRFEEDSLCSWISEPESLCNNWRGWRKQNGPVSQNNKREEGQVTSLIELAAQAVAGHIPFEVVEHFYPPIPEQLQLRIAFWSFPENEEDIRLYSCLANGSADEFQKGEHLFKAKAVKEPLQIGFHLSATVIPPQTVAQTKGQFSVAIVFDRRRISSCNCTCTSTASWCAHVVALCLFRIHQAHNVCLRAPVSESLSRLQRDQLQKFAQYLISELPQQILPTAQRLLDELLSSQQTAINTVCGAPDPTAGPSASEQTTWCLDETTLHENIKKTLIKFCVPSPTVFSDVTYLSSTAPPAASEWQSLLRPMRGREPEGMWNLLSIVREMYRRHDSNAIPLLEILTEEVLACEQILIWWFNTKISASHNAAGGHGSRSNHNSSSSSQHAASSLCDEIVTLWRLAALNPSLSPIQRDDLSQQLKEWHISCIEKVRKGRGNTVAGGNSTIKKNDIEIFSGFKPAMDACQLDWSDYYIPWITYVEKSPLHWRFSFGKAQAADGSGKLGRAKSHTTSQVSGCAMKSGPDGLIQGRLNLLKSQEKFKLSDFATVHTDGSSSEGFCDTDRRESLKGQQDSDSDLGGDIGDTTNEDRTRKYNPISSSSNNSTLVNISHFHVRKSNQGQSSVNDDEGLPSESGYHGSNISGNSGASLNNSTAALNIPAHVKVMKADDVDMNSPLVTVVSGGSRAGSSNAKTGNKNKQGSSSAVPVAVNGEGSKKQDGATAAAGGAVGGATGGATGGASGGAEVKPQAANAQPNNDEYQLYFYDPRAAGSIKTDQNTETNKKKKEEPNYFAGMKKMDNSQDILFARAEALHAHGHTKEACKLARQLAEEMLSNPPDLTLEPPPTTGKGKKNKKNQNNISSFASSTLAKAAFLCTVLLEEPDCHHLAFRVGLFGLEMPRPPASSKALEVKLAYQESELVTLLKKIPLGNQELNVIRDRAEKLKDGKLKSRGEALLPLMLASFIFDSMCLPQPPFMPLCRNGTKGTAGVRLHTDEKLGFDACVAAIGLKANISEADHPLLCEGTRRQRGEIAVAMIVHYKDDQLKLSKIMDKILDKEIHQLYKAPSLANYLPSSKLHHGAAHQMNPHQPLPLAVANHRGASGSAEVPGGGATGGGAMIPAHSLVPRKTPSVGCESDDSMREDAHRSSSGTIVSGSEVAAIGGQENDVLSSVGMWEDPSVTEDNRAQSLEYLNLEEKFSHIQLDAAQSAKNKTEFLRYNNKEADALEDENSADYKAWEAKFRCTNLKSTKKHSLGMASIDSSAPETTSSDNSPTLVRRNFGKHQGPGSDSGSSGKSSDSFVSSSSGDKGAVKLRDDDSPGAFEARYPNILFYSRSSTPSIKGVRGYKGKRIMPTVPNMPSEASAHFMFELAKTVLNKAGGTSSTSLFTQPNTNNNPTGPHRNLHLCAFQIGLYALGLHNCVSPNWLSRTYSSHVSWITGQAMEIGSAAINILIDTWEGHLTPQEVASLADRASRCRDASMVRAAAELALSSLPHAQALNPNEIQRALLQCKEQSRDMLERACLAVESAAKGGGVYPEVLFDVARRWYELYEESAQRAQPRVSQAAAAAAAHSGGAKINGEAQAVVPTSSAGVNQVVVGNQQAQPIMQLVPAQQLPTQNGQAVVQLSAQQGQIHPGAVAIPPIPYTIPPPAASHASLPHHPYIAPYSYVQQIQPNFAHHYSAPHIPLHTHNIHPSYMASYPYQGQNTFTNVPAHLQNAATLYHAQVSHLRPPQPTLQVAYVSVTAPPGSQVVQTRRVGAQQKFGQMGNEQQQITVTQAAVLVQQQQQAHGSNQVLHHQAVGQQADGQAAAGSGHHHHQQQGGQQGGDVVMNTQHMNNLQASYRVGMLAMETLARRVHDDRPQTKYARSPPYGEDVKWLLSVAMKLGTSHLQQFCGSAVNAIVSPFVLQDIALESARYLARNNPTQIQQQLRSPALNSLVQKCLQMYIQCAHQRMHHIAANDYDEFVSIVCSARNAFVMTPGGMVQFNELLQSLRRSKSCKKDLWQRIVNGLATGNV